MPRRQRSIAFGSVYHVIARFVANEWFIDSDGMRQQYLRLLGLSLEESDWECLAYAVMSNHIHLCLVAGAMPLRCWAQAAHTPFAEYVNEKRDRIGAVFTRGPTAREVRPDGVARVISYIHRNPVRAGVVQHAGDSNWTSHAAYTGMAKAPAWLRIDRGLTLSGMADGAMLDAWVAGWAIDRSEVEAAMVERPRGPGRPAVKAGEMGSDPILSEIRTGPVGD